jgi:hypothetical protein
MNLFKNRPREKLNASNSNGNLQKYRHQSHVLKSPIMSSSAHLPPQTRPKTSKRRQIKKYIAILIAIIILCLIILVSIIFLLKSRHKTALPFPAQIAGSLNYPVYYPSEVTTGYSYQPGSANIKATILFFTLTNGAKSIFVTEQSVPLSAINLNGLPKHSDISVPIGQAILGTGLGKPSIIIITASTLIELTSNKGVTKSDIIQIARAMAPQK